MNPRADGELFTAHAKRLVVVSSGPFGSPVLLERSGIGAKDLLEKHGVKVLVDLPGVGDKYQGHASLFLLFLLISSSQYDHLSRRGYC